MIQECSLVITTAFCWLPAFTWVCTTPYPSFQPFYVKTQNLRREVHQKYYEDAADLATPQRGDSYIFAGGGHVTSWIGHWTRSQEEIWSKFFLRKRKFKKQTFLWEYVSFEKRFSRSRVDSPVKISQTSAIHNHWANDYAWCGTFIYLLVLLCEKISRGL